MLIFRGFRNFRRSRLASIKHCLRLSGCRNIQTPSRWVPVSSTSIWPELCISPLQKIRSLSSAATAPARPSPPKYSYDLDDLPITSLDDKRVAIGWDTRTWSRFHHIWLRDHCRCPTCLHPKTMQRLLNTFQIPPDIKPIKVESSLQGLRVVWPAHEHTEHGEHESVYSWKWLKENSYDPRIEPEDKGTKKILWNARISQSPPTVSYNDVLKPGEEGEQALYKWLTNIDIFGFSFITDVPPNAVSTESLVRRISFIRETHYGGFWEFTSNLAKGDTAYTNIALGAHTDNTYFTDPCGLQLFHLLEHSASESSSSTTYTSTTYPNTKFPNLYASSASPTSNDTQITSNANSANASSSPSAFTPSSLSSSATQGPDATVSSSYTASSAPNSSLGGQTLLIDGFYVASILRSLYPSAYRLLSEIRIPAHAAGERDSAGIFSTGEGYTVLSHNASGELTQVRWNNDDRSVLSSISPSLVEEFYTALRTFHSLLTTPDSEFLIQLTPGTAVIVDNHRVLHGRTAFVGNRRMCGAYIGKDEWKAKLRGLREKYEGKRM
ncbi:hypothetical protein HHX47_DHR7000212 [Lentinula edodes]|nr:hypothetical protein HHX47_DHR7000212 [Lentinula edodes]